MRFSLTCSLLLSCLAHAEIPATKSATPGQTIMVGIDRIARSRRAEMAATPYQWTLAGPGALGGPNPSPTIEYTAPDLTTPNNAMYGCQVLPNDSIFNTRVDTLPADPNSASKLDAVYAITDQPISFEPSWGISYADNETPTRDFISYYDSVIHKSFPYPDDTTLRREAGDHVGIFSYVQKGVNPPDHHILTVRTTDCSIFETYMDYTDGYTRPCRDGAPDCNVQSAVAYNFATYQIQGGTDAAGLLLAPLTWHVDEVQHGEIKHAAVFTNNGYFQFNASVWPAAATAGGMAGACSPTTCLRLGDRLRLRADFDMRTVCKGDADCFTELTGLRRYGMILGDTGTNNALQVAYDVSESPTIFASLSNISAAHVPVNSKTFEVVDETSLEESADSYRVCPYNATCLGTINKYVHPQDQVMLTATPAKGPPISVGVALQGTAIGLGVPTNLPVVSGNYDFKIPYWVNGSTDKDVTWIKQSGAGSITTFGVYSPPADITQGDSAVLLGTSASNRAASVTLNVELLPLSGSPMAVRIDTGSSSPTTDGKGNIWAADPGMNGVSGGYDGYDWPNWNTQDPLRIVYQSRVRSANDLSLTVAVPNGNYLAHLLFGMLYDACSPCGSWINGYYDINSLGPLRISTQGSVKSPFFDFGLPINYQYATPSDIYVPAEVTDNLLQLRIYGLAPDIGPNYAPLHSAKLITLNGVELLPDSASPHWAIDTQQQTAITTGASLALSIVDYYTASTAAMWEIVSGPGTIDASGVLSLPAIDYANGTVIIVKASSLVNTSIVALATLCVNSCEGQAVEGVK